MVRRSPRLVPLQWPRILLSGLLLALGSSGCGTAPGVRECRILGATSRWDASGYYVVTLLVENGSPQPLDLEGISVEMTTFDAQDRVIDRKYPFPVIRRSIDRFDNDRIPLTTPDREGRIHRSHVVLRDRRGHPVSEYSIDNPPATFPPPAP